MRAIRSRPGERIAVLAGCAAAGIAYLVIGLANGRAGFGVAGLVVMLGYGAVLLGFGRRSEVVGLLSNTDLDERRRHLQVRASASTGNVLAVVLVVAFMWALAAGSDYATPLGGLCAVAGATFIIASIWHSGRG